MWGLLVRPPLSPLVAAPKDLRRLDNAACLLLKAPSTGYPINPFLICRRPLPGRYTICLVSVTTTLPYPTRLATGRHLP